MVFVKLMQRQQEGNSYYTFSVPKAIGDMESGGTFEVTYGPGDNGNQIIFTRSGAVMQP